MSHTVYLADRPLSFAVENGESVLQAGLRQGLALPFGCQSGGCGSCRVRLLEGRVDYALPPPALSAAEVEAGYILMCLARPASDLKLELHQPARLDELRPRQLPCRVQGKAMLAHDVIGLTLKLPKGRRFDYLPGQYIDVLLDEGRRRSFSLANAPNGETLELHVRVTPSGRFAQWVLNDMPDKAILQFEGPLGAFYLREDTQRPIILVAGGTGYAPVQAMLEDLLTRGVARDIHLFRGVRAQRDLYRDERIQQWQAAHPRLRYTPVLSEPDADWNGERGFVHEAVLRAYPALHAHEVYVSGPPVMVRSAKDAFSAAGLDADRLFYDSFDYAFETWPRLG